LLKRDPENEMVFSRLSPEEASSYIESVEFCNPHMLVKTKERRV
jgi:hypothetical protein